MVAGAGAQKRKTKATEYSLFAKAELGFSHLRIDAQQAVLRMYSAEKDEVLFEKTYKAPKRPSVNSLLSP